MPFLLWLQDSAVARYVQEDPYGYPIILTCHAIGMALLTGIVLMVNFRVLGVAKRVPLSFMRTLLKVSLVGFIINLISGILLFVSDAEKFFNNTPFRIKIVLLILGGILLVVLMRQVLNQGEATGVPATEESTQGRVVAALAVCVWLGVIVSGRLMAYL